MNRQLSRLLPRVFPVILVFFGPGKSATSLPWENLQYFGLQPDEFGNSAAQEGLETILNGTDFNYGLPYSLYQKKAEEAGYNLDALWNLFGSLPSPPTRQTYGVPIPLGQNLFVRSGTYVLNINCLTCHAGVVAGTVVAGLGNAHLDELSVKAVSQELLDLWNRPLLRFFMRRRLSTGELEQLKGYLSFLRTIALPSVHATGRGDNHGPWVIWRQIARMIDPARGFSTFRENQRAPLERLLNRPLPTVDPSPWWNLKYKERAFWTLDVSPTSYSTFALNLMDPHSSNTATFPARQQRTAQQLAFAAATTEPPYPKRTEIDLAKAAEGRAMFHGTNLLQDGSQLACAGCHGTYGVNGEMIRYPNRDIISLAVIGTDPAYASILHDEFAPLYQHFERSPFAPQGAAEVRYPPIVGYAPPPLKGIWASAPYFHNGSVPTVAAVLDSQRRPNYWQRSLDPWSYDFQKLGLSAQTISESEYTWRRSCAATTDSKLSAESLALRRIYATTEFGKTNSGHKFGDRMTERERDTLLEYLRLL